jgi:hypothetical protein
MFMIKKLLLLMLITSTLFALHVPVIGEKVLPIILEDQHDVKQTYENDVNWVLYAPDKAAFKIVEAFFEEQESDILQKKKALLITDVSAAPSFVISFYIKPKLRSCAFEVLMISDDLSPVIFPSKAEKVSLVKLKKGHIETIWFIENVKILRERLN